MSMHNWCVSWYDQFGVRHIDWGVLDPDARKAELIESGIDPEVIDMYEKDVS